MELICGAYVTNEATIYFSFFDKKFTTILFTVLSKIPLNKDALEQTVRNKINVEYTLRKAIEKGTYISISIGSYIHRYSTMTEKDTNIRELEGRKES